MTAQPMQARGPVVIASANGLEACKLALERMRAGAPPVEAAVAGVNLVENDPNDHSVGYGGIPNEEGFVELDASVMDGPTHKAGGVAAIQRIKNPSSVALLVMRRTDHCLLVGEGALRFAKAHGFNEENLLTDEARETWLRWKERNSDQDAWLAQPERRDGQSTIVTPTSAPTGSMPSSSEPAPDVEAGQDMTPHGTVNCLALNETGDLGGVTSTSGLSFKIAGRVGDSPIIGAGLYVDNAVGAAGSTGHGEANIKGCTSYYVVELMRQGHAPREACELAMKRVVDRLEPRQIGKSGRPRIDLRLYALRKDGEFAGLVLRGTGKMAVADADGARLVDIPGVFPRAAESGK